VTSKQLFTLLVNTLVWTPKFRFREGYFCPYCGYMGRMDTPLTARELALHLLAEHRDEVFSLIIENKK
jgi:hypothetical protein